MPDEIPARILKEYAHEFAPYLASFYNISLSIGEVPSDWRQANVIPVFKKGEKYLASNYRPVSLTCICCKVLEPGADPGFQVRGGTLKKIATSGGRREKIWGISCEKSRFYAKKSYFFPILGGRAPGASRP